MKWLANLAIWWILFVAGAVPLHAHSEGTSAIHEVVKEFAPKASLKIEKDPTGGFNVHVVTSNFQWRPDLASKEHVMGEGHAHVYLDGRKILRIYNEWFHLNTYQFATRAGEQILSFEFVGNDHAPYTIQGVPLGVEQIITVPEDEIQPPSAKKIRIELILASLFMIGLGSLLMCRQRRVLK
jgi:hypothetical protein